MIFNNVTFVGKTHIRHKLYFLKHVWKGSLNTVKSPRQGETTHYWYGGFNWLYLTETVSQQEK